MDLYSRNPDCLNVREYLGKFSNHRHQPVYSISRTGENYERPLPRQVTSADHLPPGQYRTDRDFPDREHRIEEVGVGLLTRSAKSKSITFPKEDLELLAVRERRFTTGSTSSLVGPGSYHNALASGSLKPGARSQETVLPAYTIPKMNMNKSRPLPREVSAADHIGPGAYEMPNRFNELGYRKSERLEKAAKNTKASWNQKEFSHIFDCMKPRRGANRKE